MFGVQHVHREPMGDWLTGASEGGTAYITRSLAQYQLLAGSQYY
ncbi:hypothetical protein Vi05172_g13597 [Venturia inaequalis]|nr:hypothetical protein Vi05172_g13597 [Venturia inaequalis]